MTNPFKSLPPIALLLLAACAGPMASRSAAPVTPVTVGIAAFNDFHGQLSLPRQTVLAPDGMGSTVQVPAGGAAWFASAVDSVRSKYPNHLTVSAGDLTSASQLVSSLYLDEPTVEAMNLIGLDFNAVGNHEFDRGRDELLRLQSGGCKPHTTRLPCQIERFRGAKFRYLAASTLTETGKPLFTPYAIRSFGKGRAKVRVGLIGLTLKGTSDLVSPGGIRGLTFIDEAEAVNALVPRLKRQGADAIVVLIHQGGEQGKAGDPNACTDFTGDIRNVLDRLDPRVDLVVSGHTHKAYVCDYAALNRDKPFLLTSAGNYGTMVTDIALEIDPAAHRVISRRAKNVIVQSLSFTGSKGVVAESDHYPTFIPRPDIAAHVARYADAAAVFSRRPVGQLTGPASGRTLGNLIADAQLAATKEAGAQIAFMNPFGIRASLIPATDGAVTFGDIYAVQPFNNTLITQSLTGAELKAVLEQGFDANGPEQALIPSAGFAFAYDKRRPVGQRIVAMTLNGKPVDRDATYHITTNSFLAQGGDSFTALAGQHGAQVGMPDIDALEAWLKGDKPRAVSDEQRSLEVAE